MRSKTRRIALPVMMSFALMLFLPPSSAVAIPGCEGEPAPVPESGWAGPSGMAGVPKIYEYPGSDTDLEVYEGDPDEKAAEMVESMPTADAFGEYGVAGLQWHMITESCVDQVTQAPLSTAANSVWLAARSLGALVLTVYSAAMMGDLPRKLNGPIIDLVDAGSGGIWRPLLTPVLIVGAMWMAWQGLGRKRATLSVQGSLWMVGVVALALFVLNQTPWIIGKAQKIAMAGRDASASVLAMVDPPSDESKDCPDDWTRSELLWSGTDESRDTIRVTGDTVDHMWIGFLCEPWMAGELGSSGFSKGIRTTHGWAILQSQGTARSTESDLREMQVDRSALTEAQQSLYTDTAERVKERDGAIYTTFAGHQPVERLGIATFAFVAIAVAGVLLVGLSVAVIFYQIMWLVMVGLSPVTLLIGVHPGMGRTVMERWLEYTLGALLKQVLYLLMTQIVAYLYRTIMALDLPWALQMVMVALLAAVLLWYRRTWAGAASAAAQAAAPKVANVAVSVAPGSGQDGRSGRDGSSGSSGRDGSSGSSGTVRTRGPQEKRRPSRPGAGKGAAASSPGSGGEASGASSSDSSSGAGASGRGSSGAGGGGGSQQRRGAAGATGGSGSRREDPGGSGRRGHADAAPPLRRPGQGGQEDRDSGSGRSGREGSSGVPRTPSNAADVPRQSQSRGSTAGDVRGAGTDRTRGDGRR